MSHRALVLTTLAMALAGCLVQVPGTGSKATGAGVAARPSATPSGRPGLARTFIKGLVVGPDNLPVAGATVGADLVSDASGSLLQKPRFPVIGTNGATVVANNGGNVVGTNGATVVGTNGATLGPRGGGAASFGLLQSKFETILATTDAAGRFQLAVPDGQLMNPAGALANVEAFQGESLKALSQGVAIGTELTLRLERTGTLRGRVTVPDLPGVTNLGGVDVYIPGTRYLARTDANGAWAITGVPVGTYALAADREGLGEATREGLVVRADETTSVPELALVLARPVVERVEPAAAGPGETITLTGRNFAADRGTPFDVSIGSVKGGSPVREGNRIRVTVPDNAGSAGVVVTVGNIPSAEAAFRAIRTLRWPVDRLDLVKGATQTLAVEALDAGGAPIASPTLTFTAEPAGIVAVGAGGELVGLSKGAATMRVAAGRLNAVLPVQVVVKAEDAVGQTLLGEGDSLAVVRGTAYIGRSKGVLKVRGGGQPSVLVGTEAPLNEDLWLEDMHAVVSDGAGGLYISRGTYIERHPATGPVVRVAGSEALAGSEDAVGAEARFEFIVAMARAQDGTLYVLDRTTTGESTRSMVRTVAPDGTVKTLPGRDEDMVEYAQMLVKPDGTVVVWSHPRDGSKWIHVAQPGSSTRQRVTLDLWAQEDLDAAAVAPDGRVVLVSGNDVSVWKPQGAVTDLGYRRIESLVWELPEFSAVVAAAFDEAGHLWVLDRRLRRLLDLGPLPPG